MIGSMSCDMHYSYTLLKTQKVLLSNTMYFFVPLASQLINEESPLCRQMIAEVIRTLLKKVLICCKSN